MIAINNLIFEIGARALYDEAHWHIKPGEKIAQKTFNRCRRRYFVANDVRQKQTT